MPATNAADHLPPGATVRLISPVNVKLKAGTWRISYAEGRHYTGWRFNRAPNWVWNFGIAINKGGGTGQLLYVALADGIYRTRAAVSASSGPVYGGPGGPNAPIPRIAKSGGPKAFADTITLPAPATLSFFILDYDGPTTPAAYPSG